MKTHSKRITLLALLLALASAGGFSCNDKEKGAPSFRSPSSVEDDQAVAALNEIILQVTKPDQVPGALQKVVDTAKGFNHSPAAQFYLEVAQLAQPLRGVLWRLGGVAVQSEGLYSMLVGALASVKVSKHLYSAQVDALFGYFTLPVTDAKGLVYSGPGKKTRLTEMSELQDLVLEYSKTLEAAADRVAALYHANPGFEFKFDRALIAPVDVKSTYHGRHVKFVHPYLAAGLSATYYSIAAMRGLAAYNLDDLPDYLNRILHDQIKGSGLAEARYEVFQAANALLKTGRDTSFKNVSINTPMDYALNLAHYPKLLSLKHGGASLRTEAFKLMQKAAPWDVQWATEMLQFARIANQEEYIVDARLKMADPGYSPRHYEKILGLVTGPTTFTDPASGVTTTVDLAKAFAPGAKSIRELVPNDWAFRNLKPKEIRIKVNGLPTFEYARGTPTGWPDPTFDGMFPGATSKTFPEVHRILTYDDDASQFMGTLLYLFI